MICAQGWLEDKVSEDDFRYEMMVNAHGYIKECGKYMASTLLIIANDML